ncbi:MAG: DNA-formamidopyrimidine glycosylase family protein [Myxococcota bacterium]|nr:DNA-formamidopyrimidine glycosylase family protein [Myxococcota bacterium]
MPELPEVEVMTRNLRRWLNGQELRLELVDPRLLKGEPPQDPQRVVQVHRRGKYSFIEREADTWVLHFRMTGKVVPAREGGKVRARLLTDTGAYHFLDQRCLGELHVLPPGASEAFEAGLNLGPEPYPQRQSGAWWRERLSGLRGAIKPALMRQDRVAGLGNIAASEICFRAGVDPRRPVPDVLAWDGIATEAHAFLHEVVDLEGQGDEIQYINSDPDARNPFAVYGRAGEPCLRCGEGIERIVQSGRSSFYCPSCQEG